VDVDVLENRWLHKLFLITHEPAVWPAWRLAAGLLVITWLFGSPGGRLAIQQRPSPPGLTWFLGLADWLLLVLLPRTGRSFGPVGPQLFVMAAPRLGVAVVVGLAALLLRGSPWLYLGRPGAGTA